MKIDNLKFNDSTVDSLSFNGQEVTKLVMPNGDYWEKGSSSEPVLRLAIIGAGTGYGHRGGPAPNEVVVRNNFNTVGLGGDTAFSIAILILENSNTGGIVTNPTYYNSNNFSWVSHIDDHAFIAAFSASYGNWLGDQQGAGSTYNYTFSAANNSEISSKLTISRYLNETPWSLINGTTKSRAFRVAHTARSGSCSITLHPYHYAAQDYLCPMALLPIEKNNNGEWYKKDEYTEYTNHYQVIDNNVVVFDAAIRKATLNEVFDKSTYGNAESPVDYKLNYSIANNNTSEYRDYVFAIGQVGEYSGMSHFGELYMDSECIIHIIQEPYAKNRVYYGRLFPGDFSDQSYSVSTRYHSFFETCSSKVLIEDYSIITAVSSATYGYLIAYPNDLEYDVVQTSGRYIVQSSQYIWGDRAYTILKCTQAGKVTFNKK